MTIYCPHCAQSVTIDNIGAIIPDDEEGQRTYCEDCSLNAIDDLYDKKKLEAFV